MSTSSCSTSPTRRTDIGDTLEAMSQLVDVGKAREIGASNFSAAQLEEMAAAAKERGVRPFVNLQNEYSLVQREPEAEVIPACVRLGITFVPYFPLASGLLTGKYKRDEPAPEGTPPRGVGRPRRRVPLRRALRPGRAARRVRARPRAHAARARAVVARDEPGRRQCDRRRDVARADPPNAAATEAWKLTDKELAEVDALLG